MQLELWKQGGAADAESLQPNHETSLIAQVVQESADLLQLDERANAYVLGAHAQRTRDAYRSDWQAFERWCSALGETAPTDPPVFVGHRLVPLPN